MTQCENCLHKKICDLWGEIDGADAFGYSCGDTCDYFDGWISVKDRLPDNSRKEGALCPRYLVMTKFGISLGWYNPNFKSWFVLFWFFTNRLLVHEIDFERADVPKVVRVPDGIVTHWMHLPEELNDDGRS